MIWPPSKAISIRTRSALATGHHLRENTVHGVRVDKCDLEAEQARSWLVVDEVGSGIRQLRKRRTEVADLVRDVVHPGPAAGEEPAHGRVIAERFEQLDPSGADHERGRTHALLLDGGAMLDLGTEQAPVRRHGGVEIIDRDA